MEYLFSFERRDGVTLYGFFKDFPGYLLRVLALLVFFYRLVDPLYNFGFLYVLCMKATVIFLIFSKVSNKKGDLHIWLSAFKLVVFCIFFITTKIFFETTVYLEFLSFQCLCTLPFLRSLHQMSLFQQIANKRTVCLLRYFYLLDKQ